MNATSRRAARARDLQSELAAAGLSRRELARMGLVAGGAYYGVRGLALRKAMAATAASPPTRPWVEPMPVPGVLDPGADGGYDKTKYQWCAGYYEPKRAYHLMAREAPHSFHPDLPTGTIWGYNGQFPAPVIDAEYGEPIAIEIANGLPAVGAHRGFGHPEIATHLHNFHSASESDGGPWNWVGPGSSQYKHYTMMRAGFTTNVPAEFRDEWGGDKRESLTTLFFHDHRPEYTAANVYKGLVGMFRIFDEDDTGEEGKGWNLPCGKYDVPLVFADKQFNAQTGELVFNQLAIDGFLGDKVTVNGKIQPYFEVEARKYRFRTLNGGPSRFYRLQLRKDGLAIPFTQITESGNFLEFPRLNQTKMDLWVAERSDIIVDFSRFKPGDKVYLANTMVMRDDGRGMDYSATQNANQVQNQLVEFRVVPVSDADRSQVPSRFRPLPPVDTGTAVRRRLWEFERKNGAWAINGRFWDPDIDHDPSELLNPKVQVKRNTNEIWVLESKSGGWDHPVHIHFEEGIPIKRNGIAVAPAARVRSDIHRMGYGAERLEVFMQFRDFPQPGFAGSAGDVGRYVMHCHNTLHEDHAMMATWTIVP